MRVALHIGRPLALLPAEERPLNGALTRATDGTLAIHVPVRGALQEQPDTYLVPLASRARTDSRCSRLRAALEAAVVRMLREMPLYKDGSRWPPSTRASAPNGETRMRSSSPENYNEGMTVFLCSKCGTAITPELAELAAIPDLSVGERGRDVATRRAPSTIPRGRYAIDSEPWGPPYLVQDDQKNPEPAQRRGPLVCREEGFVISVGSRQTVLVHPDDAAGLQPLPNWENSTGCCGPAGDEGLNRACPCGASVATLAADCIGPYELHLDPVRTYAFSQ